MPDDIRYPKPDGTGTGAVQGGMLVTACGTYNTPANGEPVEIRAQLSESLSTDHDPPASAATGFARAGNNWDFHGAPIGGVPAYVSSMYWLRVWIRSQNGGGWAVVGDSHFTACDPSAGGCVIDCPGYAEAPVVLASYQAPVVETIASRVFTMRPAQAILELLSAFQKQATELPTIEIAFQPGASTQDRAVWTGEGYHGTLYRMEVTRRACGRPVAVLQEFRLTDTSVQSLLRWQSDNFSVIHGGELCAVDCQQQWREGGIVLSPLLPPEATLPDTSNNHQDFAPRLRRRAAAPKRSRGGKGGRRR